MRKSILLAFLLMAFNCFGQKKAFDRSISIELVPLAQMYGYSNGLMASYNFQGKRFYHSLTVGLVFSNHLSGAEAERIKVNGKPYEQWATEIDFQTEYPFPLGGVVKNDIFEQLNDFGFHHFKPRFDYRLNRFLSYEALYKIIDKRFRLACGLGVTAGLTNREYTVVGFSGEITNQLNYFSEAFWVNINARAKYLYWGPVMRLMIDYRLTDNFRAGISGSFQYLFDRNHRVDEGVYLLGLRFEARI